MNILLTGVGAPGVQGTVYALRELDAVIIGTDADQDAVGRYLCDRFYPIPLARDTEPYLHALTQICTDEQVDVIVPQNTAELEILARNRDRFASMGVRIVVSDPESIERANNKYELLVCARELGIPTGDFALCSDWDSLEKQVLSRREKGLLTVVKPPCGNGSRGVRVIVDESDTDRKNDFYSRKPSALFCTMPELYAVLGDEFPELLVMDYLEGDEYTVDVFRTETSFLALPRIREVMRSGITFRASLEPNEQIIQYCSRLSEALGLTYCFGFQFKKDARGVPVLLECNPRVQGTMVLSVMAGANIIAASVLSASGKPVGPFTVDWSTRLVRYWGAVGVNEKGVVRI